MNCPICSSTTVSLGHANVLGKYSVQYFRCLSCGFTHPEQPYWLDEAYSNAITRSDIGLVSRNVSTARLTKAAILTFYNCNAKFVDYGGGYGMFTRLMRDGGLDYYRSDKYCANLFAQGFDADESGNTSYELLTAFEVFEHLVNPLDEIQQMLKFSKNILFSTLLLPIPAPNLDQWWYYGLEHGQHVAIYTYESLAAIARKFGLNFYSNGRSTHLFTQKHLPNFAFKLVENPYISSFVNLTLRKKMHHRTLLAKDFSDLTGKRAL